MAAAAAAVAEAVAAAEVAAAAESEAGTTRPEPHGKDDSGAMRDLRGPAAARCPRCQFDAARSTREMLLLAPRAGSWRFDLIQGKGRQEGRVEGGLRISGLLEW